jgi:erythromycin esterase
VGIVLAVIVGLAVGGYFFIFGYCHSQTVAWVRDNAVPLSTCEPDADFSDLARLKELIGSVRAVGAGEATHGTHEFFQFKHRLFRYLVTEMGFTSIAFESSLERATLLDRYVKTGEGDPRRLLTNLGFWVYDTEEVLALIEWMRGYNADTINHQKLSFMGFDIQFPQYAICSALEYLGRLDTGFVARSRAEFAGISEGTCMDTNRLAAIGDTITIDTFRKRCADLSESETMRIGSAIDAIINQLEQSKPELIAISTVDEWEWAHQFALVAKQAHEMFILEQPGHNPDSPDIDNVRDEAMASNIKWLISRQPNGSKMMLWGHNGHIAREMPNFDNGIRAMGQRLAEEFGTSYFSIGFSFDQGSFQSRDFSSDDGPLRNFTVGAAMPHGIDAVFARAGLNSFLCDTRRLPKAGPVHWASSIGYPMRNVGSGFDMNSEDEFYASINPEHAFDAIVFFNETTRARPTDWVKARFKLKDDSR